jgi:uncharacterized protein (DUF2164 family)
MNERIRLLALQAGATTTQRSGWIDYGTLDLDVEKFAELIVRECLDQCYNRGMNDALYAGQLKAAAYIEEHFGVEA